MSLTAEQRRAITHTSGNLQIVACAGSGKTEVVARRIANLLAPKKEKGGGLKPANIIAFTFTEKAAAELKQRVLDRCRDRDPNVVGLAEMYIGTIHGFCLDLLKSEIPEFLKYDVLNEIQQTLLIDRNSSKSGLTATTKLNGDPLRRYRDTGLYAQALSVLRESHLNRQAMRGSTALAGLDAYRALLSEKGYLDYSAIIEHAVSALRKDDALRTRIRARVKAVIVDEYQDVNPIQEELVALLHELGAAVTVVGDDDQTVYQWRGSDVSNILTFSERYSRVRAVRLEDNFRSSKGIVDVARLVIEKNTERLPKVMRAVDMQDYDTGDITALGFDNPDQEAAYIAQTCKALRGTMVREAGGSRAITWSDMAVLVRVTASSGPIREALRSEGIPVVSVGMDSLFDTPEAEAARQLFYMMAGRASATETVTAWANADLGIRRAVLKAAVDTAVATREKMNKENSEVRFAVYNLQRQFIGFLERIGLREETVPDGRGEVAFYNLAKFSQAISDFETIHFHSDPVRKYEAFANFLLHKAEHIYEQTASQGEQSLVPDAVQILTIHKAKGLQWAVVFVPQLMRNRFPIKRSGGTNVWHILPSAGVKGQARFLGSVEDERRLFYVAITRSQKHLHLTTAPTPDNQLYQISSEFWNDVLEFKYVKRRRQSYTARRRGTPCQRRGVTDVNLSFSDVKYFFECPYQFKLRILYGFNAPLSEALGYGKSLHDALAELHARAIAGEHIRLQVAAELVDRHLRVPYAYPKLRETLRKAAEQVIAGYIQKRQAEFDKIEFSEKQIEVALGDGVAVSGRIDLVRRRDTNKIAIVDLKSTERAQTDELTDAQLHVYALGYRELTGKDADFVETYILEENKRKARSVDGDFIEDVKDMVRATAKALRSNQFGPKPVLKNCARCDFGRMCSAGVAIVSAGKAAASRRAAR